MPINMIQTNVNITFLGGCRVGKSSIIEALWGKNRKSQVVSEYIKGRGYMSFNVTEIPSVIYSCQDIWLSNNDNIRQLKESDTIVFMVPSISFGYQEEFLFLSYLYINNFIGHNTKLMVVISKVDEIYKNNHRIYETISDVLEIENRVRKTINIYLPSNVRPESIVFTSTIKDCNMELLRENIWDCVVKRSNELIYNSMLPTIVVSGKRGCGKSSTLNRLFGLDLPTNMATACTKFPRVLHIKSSLDDKDVSFNLVDLPGIAESLSADVEYAEYYEKYLRDANVLLALSQADTRAYKQDEEFYKRLVDKQILNTHTKIVIGINQIDLLFKSFDNPDGIELNESILSNTILKEKIDDIFSCYQVFNSFGITKGYNVHPFSAFHNWNVEELRYKLLTLL